MLFQTPQMLFGLLALPVVAMLLYYGNYKRRRARENFASKSMAGRLMTLPSRASLWTQSLCILLGIASLIVASARPRWGYNEVAVVKKGIDLVFCLDISRSMLAQDISPNRLKRAKVDIRDIIKDLAGERVALVAFAGEPQKIVPLTSDFAGFNEKLDEVTPDDARLGGTDLGLAMTEALHCLPKNSNRGQAIVLFTDGEDHADKAAEVAAEAKKRGIKVYTVGRGDTENGSLIPIVGADGVPTHVTQDGEPVRSKPNPEIMKNIAKAGGGKSFFPHPEMSLDTFFEKEMLNIKRGDLQDIEIKKLADRFQIFLALGIVLLFVGLTLDETSKRRKKFFLSQPLAVVIALLLAFLVISSSTATAAESDLLIRDGCLQYDAREFSDARKSFEAARKVDKKTPPDPRIALNLGCVSLVEQKFAEARKEFKKAVGTENFAASRKAAYYLALTDVAQAKQVLASVTAVPEEKKEEKKEEKEEAKTKPEKSPEETLPEAPSPAVREQIMGLLDSAVANLFPVVQEKKDALSEEELARQKKAAEMIETLKTYRNNLLEEWREKDLAKLTKQLEIAKFFAELNTKQRQMRKDTLATTHGKPSLMLRQRLFESGQLQRELAAQLGPLYEKLTAQVTEAKQAMQQPQQPQPAGPMQPGTPAQPGAPTQPAVSKEEAEKMADALQKSITTAIEKTGEKMRQAAGALERGDATKAGQCQLEAVGQLDSLQTTLFATMAKYVELVQHGVNMQQGIIGHTEEALGTIDVAPEKIDYAELVADQQRITGYATLIGMLAPKLLEQLPPAPAPQAGQEKTTDPKLPPISTAPLQTKLPADPNAPVTSKLPVAGPTMPTEAVPSSQPPQNADPNAPMREALTFAVEHHQELASVSEQITQSLAAKSLDTVVPHQKHALELLKKMLPKDKNKDDQKKQDQQKNKDEQKKQEDQKKNEGKDDEEKKKDEEKSGQGNEKDDKKKEEGKDDEEKKKDEEKSGQGNEKDDKKEEKGKEDKQKKEDEKKEGQGQEEKKEEEQKQGQQPPQSAQERAAAQREADIQIGKVKERMEERKEKEKAIQAELLRRAKLRMIKKEVEKDW